MQVGRAGQRAGRQGGVGTDLCSSSISSLVISVSSLLCFFPGVNLNGPSASAASETDKIQKEREGADLALVTPRL